jgi:para-aminobenzoate synthetase component I
MAVSVHRIPGFPVDPLSFWQHLHPRPRHGFFFGSGAATKRDYVLYVSVGEPLHILREATFKFSSSTNCPRYVGLVGFEAGRYFDAGIKRLPSFSNSLHTPVFEFGDYPAVVKLDNKAKTTDLYVDERCSSKYVQELINKIKSTLLVTHEKTRRKKHPVRFHVSALNKFAQMVKKTKQAISDGDIYQANVSLRFSASYSGDPIALYRRLITTNPSPYACLVVSPSGWIVSSSPELLVKVEGRRVWTRPIAGTRPRGANATEDARLKGRLLLSPKERAEHIMLVDLERNDLGRVCDAGTVRVAEKYAVENYSHVMHIVSEVTGRLQKKKTSLDALRALFPGGTITGCPKIKAIEIIERTEKTSRGPFYGSAGFFAGNGDAVFNILIRTALVQKKKIYIQAGAGIVADSQAKREYREILAKAKVLLEAVNA